MGFLAGKKGLIVGIANDQSIAWGCAKHMRAAGADIAVTYLNEKADKYVRPLAEQLESEIYEPLNVSKPEQIDELFKKIEDKWGKLDFIVHSIAFARLEDLHGRVIDCSPDGFAESMDISCHSFLRLAKKAEPLMKDGGSMLTVSYYGSEKVIDNYNVMGVSKAALEASVRYAAAELGPKGIAVNAVSPGPLLTRAASGIAGFDKLMQYAIDNSPSGKLVTIDDVGQYATFLVSDAARHVTGNTLYVDGGLHIKG
ncbi:MAG: Enoyl-[acyl-carrier-protein] reductase [NADH] FabI [Proteobacteria bacterium]|nr:MAG: Enoyl-[acyl-carrier-protein] reductase [NADH] FabI [Pseudomonadota bacterium]|tara:strand:+ start:501 stop:1265 length:765 start_codon:yes stop_codon:yes gene_type:complete